MFGFFKKNKLQQLEKDYAQMLTKSVEAQRNGNIELYSELTFKADQILKEIQKQEEIEKTK